MRGLGLNHIVGAVYDKNDPTKRKARTLDVEFPKRDQDGLLQCFDCEKGINVKSNFRRHIRKYHQMIDLKCEHCEYNTTDTAYSYHRRTCTRKERQIEN